MNLLRISYGFYRSEAQHHLLEDRNFTGVVICRKYEIAVSIIADARYGISKTLGKTPKWT